MKIILKSTTEHLVTTLHAKQQSK